MLQVCRQRGRRVISGPAHITSQAFLATVRFRQQLQNWTNQVYFTCFPSSMSSLGVKLPASAWSPWAPPNGFALQHSSPNRHFAFRRALPHHCLQQRVSLEAPWPNVLPSSDRNLITLSTSSTRISPSTTSVLVDTHYRQRLLPH